jgi:hypothetical protein
LIASLFAPAGALSAGPPSADYAAWNAFTDELRKCRSRQESSPNSVSWTEHLLNLIGARQGQAERVYAIDVTQLKQAVQDVLATWEFRTNLPPQPGAEAYGVFRSAHSDLKRLSQVIEPTRKRFLQWHTDATSWLGTEFDKDEAIREMKDLLNETRAAGLGANIDHNGTLRLVEDLRTSQLAPALENGRRLVANTSRGMSLRVLGYGHFSVMELVDRLRTAMDAIVAHITARLDGETSTYGGDPVSESKILLTSELKEIARLLQSISEQ